MKQEAQRALARGWFTEKEAYNYLTNRGFCGNSITTAYSVKGEYTEETEISENSSDKHPIYETIYTAENGEMWSIAIVNDTITASPVSYNFEHNTQVVLSEYDYVVSYDSKKDKFYTTIPHDDVLIIKTVARIDADTLDKLSAEDIDKP